MSAYSWNEVIVNASGDGPSLSNSTTPTSIVPTGAKPTLLNYFAVGKMLRIIGHARLSNIVTTPGTLTLDVRLVSTAGTVVVFNGAAMQLSTTAHTTLPIWFEILLTCRAIGTGTSANLMGVMRAMGQHFVISGADPATGHGMLIAPNVTPVVGTGFDSTLAQVLDVFATFSIANAGNLIQLHQYSVEALN